MLDPTMALRVITVAVLAFGAAMGDPFRLLLGLIIFDIITGLIVASMKQSVSSLVSWNGMKKKVLMIVAVMFTQYLEPAAPQVGDASAMVCYAFALTEALSVIENLGVAGVPIPPQLRTIIVVLKSNQGSPGRRSTDLKDTQL